MLCTHRPRCQAAHEHAGRGRPSVSAEQERVVRYEDLDLTEAAGAESLHQRIRSAARDVCGFGSAPLVLMGEVRKCVDDAVARAVLKVGEAQLIAYHAQISKPRH